MAAPSVVGGREATVSRRVARVTVPDPPFATVRAMTDRPPIRIGNFSGYLGDRFTAIEEALAGDPVDVLMGDYLAEVTLAGLATTYRQNPERGGFVASFLRQLAPHLGVIEERGIKVVSNAGGFDPAGMAAALRGLVAEAGLSLRVAHVEGDNLVGRLEEFHAEGSALENLDTSAPLKDWGVEPIAANAYLGGFGIAEALRAGADIVVTGRVTDASLTVGPAAWWHGWTPDDWDALAGAVTAGHIIECGRCPARRGTRRSCRRWRAPRTR